MIEKAIEKINAEMQKDPSDRYMEIVGHSVPVLWQCPIYPWLSASNAAMVQDYVRKRYWALPHGPGDKFVSKN